MRFDPMGASHGQGRVILALAVVFAKKKTHCRPGEGPRYAAISVSCSSGS